MRLQNSWPLLILCANFQTATEFYYFFILGGRNAEYAVSHDEHVIPISDNITFVHAAAIPEVWLTAYQLLHFVGMLDDLQLTQSLHHNYLLFTNLITFILLQSGLLAWLLSCDCLLTHIGLREAHKYLLTLKYISRFCKNLHIFRCDLKCCFQDHR